MKTISQEVRLYLVDPNGISPNFGVDETITIEASDHGEFEKKVADAKEDFVHYLVANEGFYWSETVGYPVGKDDIDYEVIAD